ncbi:hypothetical protein [Sphingobacterium siyangense]|uniref:hypothetical protein n=1 Tax=Sphingobacterium siyangense TaxID=459529 RepID=UPI0019643609|nr:hypothetical protein [Sphingobacterium siyangense]QRY60402.1 hypothetical protein JVX97_13530 [Sphingobacterium siyangense]
MKKGINNLILATLIFGFFTNCHQKGNRNSNFNKDNKFAFTEKKRIVYVEKFDDFLAHFFCDSIFQISRIDFPLRGMSTEFVFNEEEARDSVGNSFFIKDRKFYWTKMNWTVIQSANLNNIEDYSFFKKKDDNYYEITYRSKLDDIVLFFRFQSVSGHWYLTYYSFEWN